MAKYLKKKKLYALAKSLIKEELPLCKECKYRFYNGSEMLVWDNYKITTMACGAWVWIERYRFDEEKDDIVMDEEKYFDFQDRKYHYHSINREPVEMAV